MFEVVLYDLAGRATRELIASTLIGACGFAFYSGQDYDIQKLENKEVYIRQRLGYLGATEKAKQKLLKELLEVNKLFLSKQCGFSTLRNATRIVDDLLTITQ